MKFKVILCLALLILIVLGSSNDIVAKKKQSTKSLTIKAHTWIPDINRHGCTKPTPTGVLVSFSFQHLYITSIVLDIPHRTDMPLVNLKVSQFIKNQDGEKCGASKNLRRRDSREVIQD